ncbi:MAG TPA: hypothetical protein EYP74_01335 [Anaerolineales bacterium]|nr:hypothetical protein [Anaerolineales bacterium]
MNPYLVTLLIIAIVVFSNLIMFAAVRGSSGMRFEWFKNTKTTLSQPYQEEDKHLNELRQRVEGLEGLSEKKNK